MNEQITVVISRKGVGTERKSITLTRGALTKVTFHTGSFMIKGDVGPEYTIVGELCGTNQFGTNLELKTKFGLRSIYLERITDIVQNTDIILPSGCTPSSVPDKFVDPSTDHKVVMYSYYIGGYLAGTVEDLKDGVEVDVSKCNMMSLSVADLFNASDNTSVKLYTGKTEMTSDEAVEVTPSDGTVKFTLKAVTSNVIYDSPFTIAIVKTNGDIHVITGVINFDNEDYK